MFDSHSPCCLFNKIGDALDQSICVPSAYNVLPSYKCVNHSFIVSNIVVFLATPCQMAKATAHPPATLNPVLPGSVVFLCVFFFIAFINIWLSIYLLIYVYGQPLPLKGSSPGQGFVHCYMPSAQSTVFGIKQMLDKYLLSEWIKIFPCYKEKYPFKEIEA